MPYVGSPIRKYRCVIVPREGHPRWGERIEHVISHESARKAAEVARAKEGSWATYQPVLVTVVRSD